MTEIIIAVLPSLIVGICMAVLNRKMDKREKEQTKLVEARREESMLALELQMATAKLSLASALALKRGKANGEVEEGIAAYNEARKKYLAFLNKTAIDNLEK